MRGALVSDHPSQREDASLVSAARGSGNVAGDAFRALYERYAGEVLAYLRRVLGRHALAEDVLQETFLRVHQHLERFDSSRPFRPWLYRIAHNAACDALRRRAKIEADQALQDVYLHDPSQSDPVLRTLAAAEAEQAAALALAAIPEESRSLLLQRHGLGLKLADLAHAWGVSERTIRNRLRKAIQDLTRALLAEGGAS